MIISNKAHRYLKLSGSFSGRLSGPFSGLSLGSILVWLSISLLLTACDNTENYSNSFGSSSGSSRQPAHRVAVITVEKKPVHLTQTISGTLEAVTQIRLYNEESGRITKLPYSEGDSVKKGDLLVQFDNELMMTDVAIAKATREQEKVDLQRLIKLLPKNISTEEEVAQARTRLSLAIAEEKRQLTRLKRTSIRAPIDGLITERNYEPGDQIEQLSLIHTIIDPSSLLLKASIAERWIPLINKQQDVLLSIDALGDKKYPAEIVRIHPTINIRTHKGIIEILLDPVPENAKVGQFARASIDLRAVDRLVVPVHTIHFEPEGAFVFRIIKDENGDTVAEKVFIEQGQQFGEVTEVLTGLNVGDKIVSRGYLGLREGKMVKVMNADNDIEDVAEKTAESQQPVADSTTAAGATPITSPGTTPGIAAGTPAATISKSNKH